MILDGYWKLELHHIRRQLIFWSGKGAVLCGEMAQHKVNRGLLYSAAIIRKIVEDEQDAKDMMKKVNIQPPPLPVMKVIVPVEFYPHVDSKKIFINSKAFLHDYDMTREELRYIPLSQVCNQIIHSYVWATIFDAKGRIYGVSVASDRFKEAGLYLLNIQDWISTISEVIAKCNI